MGEVEQRIEEIRKRIDGMASFIARYRVQGSLADELAAMLANCANEMAFLLEQLEAQPSKFCADHRPISGQPYALGCVECAWLTDRAALTRANDLLRRLQDSPMFSWHGIWKEGSPTRLLCNDIDAYLASEGPR